MRPSERWIVYPGLLVLGGFTFVRQETRSSPPDAEFEDLRVRSLVVVTPDGKRAVTIKAQSNGAAVLAFIGTDGRPRSAHTVSADGVSTVVLSGKDGKGGLVLGADAQGWPYLSMLDLENHHRLRLGVSAETDLKAWSAGLERGEAPTTLPSDTQGVARLMLVGPPQVLPRKPMHGTLSVDKHGASLSLAGPGTVQDQSVAELYAIAGGPSLGLLAGAVSRAVLGTTSLETTKTGAVEQTSPSSLVLFDKEGKVIFRAP